MLIRSTERTPAWQDGPDHQCDWVSGRGEVEDPKIVQRNLVLQREWYGEPLGDRVRRLVRAFNVSQANLADVLGISAPMLSQVMSGRRAKIGNPSVLARLIMLERKVLTRDVAAGKPEAMRQALADVRDSKPTVGRDLLPVDGSSDATTAVNALRNILASDDLAAAADIVDEEFPELAELLRRASVPPPATAGSASPAQPAPAQQSPQQRATQQSAQPASPAVPAQSHPG
jgi:transcriptional regulator with XRE-family HTH domain